jgi:hypothetical protein
MIADVVNAEARHLTHIVANIRAADGDELRALYQLEPDQVLSQSFQVSRLAWTGRINGVPVCMFGVAKADDLPGNVGRPWLIGTEELERHSMAFLRRCGGYVGLMSICFDRLENYVDLRNRVAVQWLTWLGFRFDEPVPGERFVRFWRDAA